MIAGGGHPEPSGAPEPAVGPGAPSGVSSASRICSCICHVAQGGVIGHAIPCCGPQRYAEPTLLDVVRVLSRTFNDTGVLIWLNARNQYFGGRTAISMIGDGRTAEVLAAAERIEAGG